MNDLVETAASIPSTAPPMSMGLDIALRAIANPHPDIGAPKTFPHYLIAEAKRQAWHAERDAAPATSRDWAEFLAPVAAVVANAPGKDAYASACRAFEFAMPSMPRAVLSTERQREAMRRFTFWPKPAELAQWLDPLAAPTHSRLALLRIVAKAQTAIEPEAPCTPTEAERADADAKVAALKALSRSLATSARPPVKPCYLTGEHLRLARLATGRYPASVTGVVPSPLHTSPVVHHETPLCDTQTHPDAAMAIAIASQMRGER